ncbi:TIGR03936 family radical SAM-associated protein [Anaeromicropila herbilytica]|uniref:Radical SAM protein n=1 Tax=Anaeromicropila herbilytica TaxID=2785025 RepID=A0A7R7ELA5_9FIRM|nr:TIGR03936 family radical SAM-associated protein [Anaeromicropila herbilytica]BCN30691.1 radical SAM protein [Anaeromicropila herbilytica]
MKARLKFSKTGSMKFIGHLDIMRYFQKAFRRSEIAVEYSQGYSPHQLISFAAPLGVGLTSEAEYLDMQLSESLSSKKMIDIINETMVEGINVEGFRALSDDSKNAMSIVAAADYSVSVKEGYIVCDDFANQFKKFVMQDEITILKKSKKSEKEVDIKPFIYHTAYNRSSFDKMVDRNCDSITVEQKKDAVDSNSTSVEQDKPTSSGVIFMQLATGSVNNLKPELVMEAFCNSISIEYNPFAYQVHRIEIYADLGDESERKLVSLQDLGTEIE